MMSPFSSRLEMSPSASLPKRFFTSALEPSLVCSSPSSRRAKARCSSSTNPWSRNTSTACSSMPARISASVSGSWTCRRSTGLTSAAKCWWSFRNVRPIVSSPSAGQALVHAVHVGGVKARDLVGRRQRLVVEEARQLVVPLAEARRAVELGLQPQRLAAELGEEVLGEAGAVGGVRRVDDELDVRLRHAAAEDAQAERVGGRAVRLRHQTLRDE